MANKNNKSKSIGSKNKKLAVILGMVASCFYLFFFLLQHFNG
jgi:hypothetical protein|tara:strand:+ start:257 stop:382 length:126 start_codon:yes stop_codon:yes gene_type:complete